jgi:ferredoxin
MTKGVSMRIEVDLDRCQDHGQCVFAAPSVFDLNDDGRLAFRDEQASGVYVSRSLDVGVRDAVEEAVDICPTQAILLRA